MGLEYNDMGAFADFDVFFKDKKISAYTELESHPGLSRNDIGMLYRNEIMKNMIPGHQKRTAKAGEKLKEKPEIKSKN